MGKKKAKAKKKARGKQEMKTLTILVPEKLHRRFKAVCARDGVDMSEEVRSMLEKRVARRKRKRQ